MDCWLPGTLCGLLKTFCCLEVTWSAAFPPSSGGVFLPPTLPGPGLCWANILEQLPSWAAEHVWSFHHGAVTVSSAGPDLVRPATTLLPCVNRSHGTTYPREAINEKFPLPRCLPRLMCNTQSGKSWAAEDFWEEMPFKKFQKWFAVHWGWGAGNKCFFRNSQCQHNNSVEECF